MKKLRALLIAAAGLVLVSFGNVRRRSILRLRDSVAIFTVRMSTSEGGGGHGKADVLRACVNFVI